VFLVEHEVLETQRVPALGLRRRRHQVVLVLPRDGPPLEGILRRLVLHAEVGQVVRLVGAEDRVTRVAHEIDVVRLGKQARDPRQDQRRLRELPPFVLGAFRLDVRQVVTHESLELRVHRHVDDGGEVPFEAALPRHVPREDAAGVVERLRGNLVARFVEGTSHEDATGVERVRDGACAGVAAPDDGDQRHGGKPFAL
jgi:hypothetical protein